MEVLDCEAAPARAASAYVRGCHPGGFGEVSGLVLSVAMEARMPLAIASSRPCQVPWLPTLRVSSGNF